MKEEDFPANQAENLGEYLGIRQGRMEDLSKKSGGDPDRLLSLVITEWLNNDREKSWPKLAKALKLCNQKLMAEKIGAEKGMVPLYTEVSSFLGVGIEELHCIQRCPHFKVLE